MKEITVVIPVFNQVHFTKKCLGSLISGASKPQTLVIIDNQSTDETPQYLKEVKSQIEPQGWTMQIVSNPKNVGVGSAFNQGIRLAETPYILLGNNDTWIMPGWDEGLLRAAKKWDADMVGAYYDEAPFDEGAILRKAQRFIYKNAGRATRDWAAIFMLYKKEVFEKIGLFDEQFFITYEDRDLRERMDRAGLRYYKTGDCFIWHHSKGTRDAGGLVPQYEIESLNKFIKKWGFDPRPLENTFYKKQRIKWTRFKNRLGFL